MKNVLSIGITSSSQQPYTKTTHEWYNAMSKDVAEAFVKSLIPSSAYTGKLVILSGCTLTGTNPGPRTVTDGWVWYSGEIFRVNSGTFTTGVGEIGVWSILEESTNLTFSDGASKPVHQEKTLVFSNGEPGSGMFDENSADIIKLGIGYVEKSDLNINKACIPIGTWDVNTQFQKNINYTSYGFSANKIISIGCIFYGDDGVSAYGALTWVPDDSGASSSEIGISIGSTTITLQRKNGGFFGSQSNFLSNSSNRGYVTIEYLI